MRKTCEVGVTCAIGEISYVVDIQDIAKLGVDGGIHETGGVIDVIGGGGGETDGVIDVIYR